MTDSRMTDLLRTRPVTTPAMLAVFSDRTTIAHALAFESALSQAQVGTGVIPPDVAQAIADACANLVIDPAELADDRRERRRDDRLIERRQQQDQQERGERQPHAAGLLVVRGLAHDANASRRACARIVPNRSSATFPGAWRDDGTFAGAGVRTRTPTSR